MAKIVLAHGFLGFGSDGETLVSYFNGIRSAYENLGHEVATPTVPPMGSLQTRSDRLTDRLEKKWGMSEGPIYMIGHSMGGLDCRRVIAAQGPIGKRVKRLITICTPHFGSPVADAFASLANPLRDAIPAWLRAILEADAGAIQDLRTRSTLQDPDVPGVDYKCVGADAAGRLSPSTLFSLSEKIGHLTGQVNDGVVTVKSAARNADPLLDIWPVDHGGAVGWPSDLLGTAAVIAALRPPPSHVQRYVALLSKLIPPA